MNDLYWEILKSWIRTGLTVASGLLIAHHALTAPQGEAVTTLLTAQIVNALPGLAASVWSMVNKWYQLKMVHTALAAPAGTHIVDIRAQVSSGLGAALPVVLLAALLGGSLTLTTACASTGLSLKQKLTVDVLQPTHDALANFQDLEISTYKSGALKQLTPAVHRQIEAKLATVFKYHAIAVSAARAWRAGDPVPNSVLLLKQDIDDIFAVVKSVVPSTDPLLTMIQSGVDALAPVLLSMGVK